MFIWYFQIQHFIERTSCYILYLFFLNISSALFLLEDFIDPGTSVGRRIFGQFHQDIAVLHTVYFLLSKSKLIFSCSFLLMKAMLTWVGFFDIVTKMFQIWSQLLNIFFFLETLAELVVSCKYASHQQFLSKYSHIYLGGDYMRETCPVVVHLGFPKMSPVWKYFLYYIGKKFIRSINELKVDQKKRFIISLISRG